MTTPRPLMLKYLAIALAIFVCGNFIPASAQSLPVTSGLRVWYDATDVNGNGTTPTNGAVIPQWADKSGNALHIPSAGSGALYESAGLNGLPSVRLNTTARLTRGNIFTGSTVAQMTLFAVQSREAETNNFAVSLNGTQTGAFRYSVHIPWWDGNIYFDAGGCCSATRVFSTFGIPIGQANLVTAGNSTTSFNGVTWPSVAAVNQFVRVNATTKAADNTAIAPGVTYGLNLGTVNSAVYNGRFSEFIVYERALSIAEIEQVECYLAAKWALSGVTACGTPVSLSISKSNTAFAGSPSGGFNVPGGELIYTLDVNHISGNLFDSGSFFLVDKLPTNVEFYRGDLDGSFGPFTDPVGFTNAGSGLVWNYANSVGYSNASSPPTDKSQCTYSPSVGYDPNVKYICVFPQGDFIAGAAEFKFRARIK